jgi:hypothetical protein
MYWNTNDGTDGLRINLNGVPLNSGLKYDPTVIILNDLQVPIKLTDKPRIHRTCTSREISPVIDKC